jgi:hypothetical protein
MSSTYISAALRRQVEARAGNCCEYCRVHRSARLIPYHIDHVISEKLGGQTSLDNLSLSCYLCNAHKGSDVASVDWKSGGTIVPLFHPRRHRWEDHFSLKGGELIAHTAEARVTIALLQLNASERITERELLIENGVYPC